MATCPLWHTGRDWFASVCVITLNASRGGQKFRTAGLGLCVLSPPYNVPVIICCDGIVHLSPVVHLFGFNATTFHTYFIMKPSALAFSLLLIVFPVIRFNYTVIFPFDTL